MNVEVLVTRRRPYLVGSFSVIVKSSRTFVSSSIIIADSELDSYIAAVTRDSQRGVTLATKNIPNWSFGQSFFFSGTVITTIGETVE